MESLIKLCCRKECIEYVDFHRTTHRFSSGDSIFVEGQKVEGLYIIKAGKAKVFTSELDGKQRAVRLAADNDILGHRGFGGDWTYPVSAVALVDSEVDHIPLNVLNVLMMTNSEFTYQLMMFFAEELRRSEEKNMFLPVKSRIAKAILWNYEAFNFVEGHPGKLSFTLARKDFASYAETTYESVVRVLSELNKNQVIQLEGKEIVIKNLKQLRKIASPETKA